MEVVVGASSPSSFMRINFSFFTYALVCSDSECFGTKVCVLKFVALVANVDCV